jgi:hypothetical protein
VLIHQFQEQELTTITSAGGGAGCDLLGFSGTDGGAGGSGGGGGR